MRAYLRWLGTSMTILLAVLLCVSFGVDAFGLFGTRLVPERRFPAIQRILFPGADRTVKAIDIGMTNRQEDIVFIGSSRVALPFDPASPTLRELTTYNAGLIAGRLMENIAVANYAVLHWPGVRRIVWALDFDILFDPKDHFGDFDESAFAGQPLWKGIARSLLSWGSVARSFGALGQAFVGKVKADADRNGRFHYDDYYGQKRPDARQLFLFGENVVFQSMSGGADVYSGRVDDRFLALKQCLAMIKAHGIDVDLVALPLHARLLELIRLSGNWEVFEAWKRRIADLVDEVEAGPGTGHIRGFDFALVHPLTTEETPEPGAVSDARYFYDSGHLRPIVADVVVSRLIGRRPPLIEGADFGLPIGDSISEQNLADQRAKFEAWRAAHVDETTAMARSVSRK